MTPTPSGYCQCGCGERTNLAPKTSRRNGWVKGQPLRFARNHNRAGSRQGPDYIEKDCGFKTPCWVWQRRVSSDGYGREWSEGRNRLAHRLYFERHRDPIPAHLEPDHLCRNRRCVNPEHLELVPRAINIRRGAGTKLTQSDVDAIRRSGASHVELADLYDVHPSTISRVRSFQSWLPIAT